MTSGSLRQAPVRVVGAGLSGLAAAWFLTERGRSVELDEASMEPGGLLSTHQEREGLVETAARGFLWTPRVAELFKAAKVEPLFASQASKRRYIFRAGEPRRWPLGVLETASVVVRGGGALLTGRTKPRGSESVEAWGHRVLGRAGTRWMLAPALQGIYASPLAALSAHAIFGGGRVRGKLATPPRGMRQLVDGLVTALRGRGAAIRFDSPVGTLEPNHPTIVATPAPVAAALVAPHAPQVSEALARIRLTHLLSVTAFFSPAAADLRGFGLLFPHNADVPAEQAARALGVLFNSDMFAGRSDVRSETWIYGSGSPDEISLLRRSISTALVNDRQVLTGRREDPIACYPTQSAQRLPVYGSEVPAALASFSQLPSWLTLCGNYAGKIGVSALVEGAERAAARATLST